MEKDRTRRDAPDKPSTPPQPSQPQPQEPKPAPKPQPQGDVDQPGRGPSDKP